MSLEEARALVKGSGALLLLNCDISSTIALDVVRKNPNASISREAFENKIFGLGFSPRLHTLVVWFVVPNIGKPNVMQSVVMEIGAVIFKREIKMTTITATQLMMHATMLFVDTAPFTEANY